MLIFKIGCYIKVPIFLLFFKLFSQSEVKKEISKIIKIYIIVEQRHHHYPLMALLVPQASLVLSTTVICGGYHPCRMGSLLPAFNLKASYKI